MSSVYLIALLLHCSILAARNNIKFSAADDVSIQLPRPLKLQNDYDENYGHVERIERSRRPTLIDIALQASVREGLDAMNKLYTTIEPNILRNGLILNDSHPAALLSKFSAPQVDSEAREMAAFATISATKAFSKNYKYFNDLARQAHNQKISLRRTALEGLCPPRDTPVCMPASDRYRTHDGTCNNKKRLRWGAAQMPFNRFLPPEYGDGVDTVRSSVEGGALSSSRFVSLLVHGARDGDAPLTLMLVQWGQLLDHDMTSTAQPRSINGSVPSCCGSQEIHPSCYPIKVPLDDPWLAPLKVRCLEFLRSAPAQRRDCVLSWREQTNQATSYIDASPIYSNNAKSSDNARTFHKGLLVFGRSNVNKADDVCLRGAIERKCIRAGDGRSGEQPGLLALHHVWVGEHNRIATELSEMNAHWSDEKVYQETRRIIGAMFQHITFREFLPIVLGREVVKLFDLELVNTGYFNGYNPKINPSVANAFAAAAFRFGHSLVQNSYIRCDRHHNVINNNVSLHEEFQHGDLGTAGSLHRLLRGMAMQRALKRDEFITPELTNHLFQTPGFPFGLDLAAINIQRGRDHGIAPYTAWRVPCGLTPINTWDDFANVVGPESARRIGHAYRSVHDIDLFVGGIAERPVVGGLVGPVFACIIAQQFSNSRKGDRFWYENGGFESSFTPAQLHSIRHVSLAQVLCQTVGEGTFQPHIFIPPEFPGNNRLPCGVEDLAPIDLNPWQEQDPLDVEGQRPGLKIQDTDRIFDIMTETTITRPSEQIIHDPLLHRIDVVSNGTKIFNHKPHIDFIPNGSIGFQRPTRVSDKLDLKRKVTTTKQPKRPSSTAGVNNKLDKRQKLKTNIKNANRRKIQTTTKRTVIINNVAIELRNAVDVVQDANQNTSNKETIDILEPRTEDTDTNSNYSANATDIVMATTLITEKTNKATLTDMLMHNDTKDERIEIPTDTLPKLNSNNTNSSLDPLEHSTAPDHKRVQRKLKSTSHTPLMKPKLSDVFSNDMPVRQNTSTKFFLNNIRSRVGTSTTANPKKGANPTKRNIELRQYHNAPIYTRPQKVVVNGPNADQYEIEINIRQTNKSSVEHGLTTYDDYTTAHRPLHYDRYTQNYQQHSGTTPIYGFYQQPPNTLSINVHTQQTKPPTIIYVDDDERTTTKAPGLLQNFLSFAANGFSNNRRPTDEKHRPDGLTSNIFSSPRPPFQVQFPITTSGVGGQPGNAGLSAAISSNGFGAIAGVASANGGDSIFSFNIQPGVPPAVSQTSIISKPNGAGGFGFYSPTQNTIYSHTPSPQNAHFPIQSIPQIGQPNTYQNSPSPFSASPYQSQSSSTYYNRQNRPQLKTTNKNKLGLTDYDYLSRTLEPITDKKSELIDSDEDLYDYDADSLSMSTIKKFDRDGYIRPELMAQALSKTALTTTINKTNHTANKNIINDNYVMSMLNATSKPDSKKPSATQNLTNTDCLTDKILTVPRHFLNAILAEDPTPATVTANQNSKSNSQKVAFAPIKLLTNVERPDNWVIFDEPLEKQLLPSLPEIRYGATDGTSPSAEIPTPIKNIPLLWLRKYLTTETEQTIPTSEHHTNEFKSDIEAITKLTGTDLETSTTNPNPNRNKEEHLLPNTNNTDATVEEIS